MEPELKGTPEIKDLYKVLIDTRNLEINLFWQRSNYFLVLNTGIGLAFFNSSTRFAIVLSVAGVLASILWFFVCLGSKFWQVRWEQKLADFERQHMPELGFFNVTREHLKNEVERGLASNERTWRQRLIYSWVVGRHSVSYSMMRLSLLFFIGWVVFLGITIWSAVAKLATS